MEWEEIEGNEVHSTAIVNWEQISIGTGNKIGPYVCIGTDAQHTRETVDACAGSPVFLSFPHGLSGSAQELS